MSEPPLTDEELRRLRILLESFSKAFEDDDRERASVVTQNDSS